MTSPLTKRLPMNLPGMDLWAIRAMECDSSGLSRRTRYYYTISGATAWGYFLRYTVADRLPGSSPVKKCRARFSTCLVGYLEYPTFMQHSRKARRERSHSAVASRGRGSKEKTREETRGLGVRGSCS